MYRYKPQILGLTVCIAGRLSWELSTHSTFHAFLGTGKELPGVTFAQVPSEVRSNRQKADRTFGNASKVGQYHLKSMTDYHLAH